MEIYLKIYEVNIFNYEVKCRKLKAKDLFCVYF
jgi:hypothetical protein